MKAKITILFIGLFLLLGCTTYHTQTLVNDYTKTMVILEEYFPEIYGLYKNGIVWDIRVYEKYTIKYSDNPYGKTTKNRKLDGYHIQYRYR